MHRFGHGDRSSSIRRLVGIVLASTVLVLNVLCCSPQMTFADNEAPGLDGISIVIDAGHGGPDSGARATNGKHEKDVTLSVAMRVGALFQEAGAQVHYTRISDDDLATDTDRALRRRQNRDLRNRVTVAKKYNADMFISIHCNSVASDKWAGAQTLYQRGNADGERLAKAIQQQFRSYLLPTKRSAEDTSTLFLLKRIPKATVIAEIGFLSNVNERDHLTSAKYQDLVAYSIYVGGLQYLASASLAPVTGIAPQRATADESTG